MIKVDTRKDILLLLFYAPGKTGVVNEPIVGRTKLVKLLFLFKKEALEHFRKGTPINEDNFYQFFPWKYGPFSTDVYDDLTFFLLRGFVDSNISNEEALPESAAEWELWLDTTDDSSENDFFQIFQEESFSLSDKGVKFTESLWNELSENQRSLLTVFKTKFTTAPLRGILRYVYEKYNDMTARSEIKDDILSRPF